MNFFDSTGTTNATSLKDALGAIVKYASILEEGMPANTGLAGQADLNDEKQAEFISRALMTEQGKIALAQSMPNPIR